jgi:DNA-binding HxlR family transcriptional regulator
MPAAESLWDTTPECPLGRTLDVLRGKWATLIVHELLAGPRRFGDLRAALPGASAKTLAERLRILEHQGVATRTVHAEVPPRVVYALTPRGRALESVMRVMWDWGAAD